MLFFCLSTLTGCTSTQTTGEYSETGEEGFTEYAYPFTDVPVPYGFSADRKKSFVYESGTGTFKVGRLYYSGWNKPREVVDYYQNAMINKGWELINSLVHEGTILNYQKEGWACTLIVTEALLKTNVEIQIGPK